MLTKLSLVEADALRERIRQRMKERPHWREGQAAFNCLHEINPELASSLLETENDPFFVDKRLPNFWKAIIE